MSDHSRNDDAENGAPNPQPTAPEAPVASQPAEEPTETAGLSASEPPIPGQGELPEQLGHPRATSASQNQGAPQPAPQGQSKLSKSDEKTWGVVMHLVMALVGLVPMLAFIAPLIVWLIFKDRSRMLDDHGRSALNWAITYLILAMVFGALMVVYVGFLLLPLLQLTHVIMCIVAAVRAAQRRKFKYPIAIPFLRVGDR
ncbi:DUF4870 domain-containing protein [Nesterenkonia populi]